MNLGKLKHHVIIQQPLTLKNSYGEDELSYVDFLSAWAEINPLSGNEFFIAQQTQSSVSHKIRMRYYPGITPGMQVLYGERTFNITSVLNVNEADVEILIYASEAI